MTSHPFRSFFPIPLLGLLILVCGPVIATAFPVQLEVRIEAQEIQVDAADEEKQASDETEAESDTSVINTANAAVHGEEIGDKFIRFHMWDGSIMGGDVAVDSIDVETEFGVLTVPIDKILKFHPGLDSLPNLNSRMKTLIENLGDKEFEVREQAHRDLLSMGNQIRKSIEQFDDGGSAERKKHLTEIKKQFVETADEFSTNNNDPVLIRGDTIVTEDFTIVGKIKQDEFQLGSKFGTLNIKLQDIKLADRTFNMARDDIRKTVKVDCKAFFQTDPESTKIRVNRGDQISIKADGTVKWENWNKTSDPDGLDDQGDWNGIKSGTLAARIGKSGKVTKVGTKANFVAQEAGILYLGIAIRDNYANNNSYRWTGNYTAKVLVHPAGK